MILEQLKFRIKNFIYLQLNIGLEKMRDKMSESDEFEQDLDELSLDLDDEE